MSSASYGGLKSTFRPSTLWCGVDHLFSTIRPPITLYGTFVQREKAWPPNLLSTPDAYFWGEVRNSSVCTLANTRV
eukprot:4854594-Prymnesium_polylepis.1